MAAGRPSFAAAYSARGFLALALGATAVYTMQPGSSAQAVIALAICSASAFALALRMRFARPRDVVGWRLLLLGQMALLGSFAVSLNGPLLTGTAAAPVAGFLAIANVVCLTGVVALLASRRDGSRWVFLDVVTIAVGLGLLTLPVLESVGENGALSAAARWTQVTFTVTCAVLLASALRLLVTRGGRHPALWLFLAGCGALVGAALSWDWLSLTGHDGRTYSELGLLLYAALVGTAALTGPDTKRRKRPSGGFADRRGAVVLNVGALLVAPSMVAIDLAIHADWHLVVIAAGGATLMSLLLAVRLIVLLNGSERLARELSDRNAKLAEHALLVQSSDHAVFACNTDAVVTSWNPAAERLYGYSAAEAIGQSIVHLTAPPGMEKQLEDHRDKLRRGGTVTALHAQRRRKDGSLFDAVLTISPAYDDAGDVITFFSVVRDESTERRQAKEREALHLATQLAAEHLAEQVEQMRELDRMKDDFVASVSHELRTPLTSISGYLGLVLDRDSGELNEEQRHFLEVVDRNSQRLLRLVNDLLDVALLGAGKLVLEPIACDAVALVAECVERAEAVGLERGIHLRLDARTDAQLEADPMRLGQVVDNLLSNALKFTLDGGFVDVRVLDCPAGVAIEVADRGMGISPSVHARLFERFYRAPGATAHAIQGTGLGLWITKTIVVAHGGTIDVESVDGYGSTFRIELPRTLPAGVEAAA